MLRSVVRNTEPAYMPVKFVPYFNLGKNHESPIAQCLGMQTVSIGWLVG